MAGFRLEGRAGSLRRELFPKKPVIVEILFPEAQ